MMKQDRIDSKLDVAVNRGLAAALLVDFPAGVKVMIDQGVPPHVVTRVFLTPQQRRASDWKN
jgi:hypothetical protein